MNILFWNIKGNNLQKHIKQCLIENNVDVAFLALHEFLWDSYLKLSHIFNWNAPSDPRCEDFFAGIVLAAIERASLG